MSRFGELPEILTPDYGISLWELQYFHCDRTFVIGEQVFDLKHPDLNRALHMPEGEPVKSEELTRTPVCLESWGKPLSSPRFYSWLINLNSRPVFQETSNVMRQVFEELDRVSLQARHNKEMSEFGFSVTLLREGHVKLSTLGSCACMGVVPDGGLISAEDWGTGFASFDFHNIDWPTQYVSLLAGLGHLAVRCEQET